MGELEDPHAGERRRQVVGHDRITLAQTGQARPPFISAAAYSAPRMKTTPE